MNPNLEKEDRYLFGYSAEVRKDDSVHVHRISAYVYYYYDKNCPIHWEYLEKYPEKVAELRPTGRYRLRTDEEGEDHIDIETHIKVLAVKKVEIPKPPNVKPPWYKPWGWLAWYKEEQERSYEWCCTKKYKETNMSEEQDIWVPDNCIVHLERYKPTSKTFTCE